MGSNEKRRKSQRRQILLVLLFAVAGYFLVQKLLVISSEADLLAVHFVNPDGSRTVDFKFEVARSQSERTKGLMYRKELAPNRGMIFVYPEDKVHSMWMRNTYISLDMLFLNADNKVVGIIEQIPILNEEMRSVAQPSRYVVELAAGVAKANKIQVGSVAKYAGTLSAGR